MDLVGSSESYKLPTAFASRPDLDAALFGAQGFDGLLKSFFYADELINSAQFERFPD